MLKITGLSKSYLQRGIVLNNLELDVNEGETIAITGPSGSGKTTLLNLIGLLDNPDSGDIVFRNRSILLLDSDSAAEYRNMNIGFVFQEHLLLPHLTINENIILPLLAGKHDQSFLKERQAYGDELINEVGLTDLKNNYPDQISGGEAQRAALVRALINRPALLLADEPTGSLDETNARILAELLSTMNQKHGISVIAATHSSLLAGMMTRRLKLEHGMLTSY